MENLEESKQINEIINYIIDSIINLFEEKITEEVNFDYDIVKMKKKLEINKLIKELNEEKIKSESLKEIVEEEKKKITNLNKKNKELEKKNSDLNIELNTIQELRFKEEDELLS